MANKVCSHKNRRKGMKRVFVWGAGLGVCLWCVASLAYAAEGTTAKAVLTATDAGAAVFGEVHFTQKENGVEATADLAGTPAGTRGFHVHENGSCAEAGAAAGGHFNPDRHEHGLLPKDGLEGAHAGDMGNITIAEDGSGDYSAFLKGLSLSEGRYNIMGKAVILHEKADNFGQPTGNAGGRIGCGIIEIIK